MKSVTIPNSVRKIGDCAFSGCTSLMNVTIGSSVTEIGYNAFCNCSKLTSVIIPNSMTEIGDNAFYGSGLMNVTIPSSVTTIGDNAFGDCTSITELYTFNPTPPDVGGGNFTNAQYLDMNVYVPQGSLETYQSADVWKNFWNLQEFDTTGVETVRSVGNGSGAVYHDIQGRRLDASKNGLNIINGRKVMMRK